MSKEKENKEQNTGFDEDKLMKEMLIKEIKKKVVDRINKNDPEIVKTIKSLLDEDSSK